MTSPEVRWIFKIARYLDWPEKILLLALAVGSILTATGNDASIIVLTSLYGLAAIFFLRAYSPIEAQPPGGNKLDFKTLLGYTILPKVMWINSSIMTVGIAFWLAGFQGYEQLLFIGGSSMIVIFFLLVFLLSTGAKNLKYVGNILLRAVPLAVSSFLILWNKV
jgi:hypothetical protein